MNGHKQYHQDEETQRMNNSNVRHGERVDRYPAICEGCTTPAILCPNGNEPKNQVVDCGSKNYTVPAPAPKVEDEIVDALLEAAQCLDDCLIRIYPEEFSQKHINAAAERFGENCGTIARIATIADKLRTLAQRAGEERYTLKEVSDFLFCQISRMDTGDIMSDHKNHEVVIWLIERLNHVQDGIAAVTNRKGG